jgi:hypothetical protein
MEDNTISILLEPDDEGPMLLSPDSIYSSVRYIPLETTDESIFYEINKIVVYNDHFFILDEKQATLLVFDGTGRYLRKLNKKGNGPGEYLSLDDFFISDGLLYVFSSDIQKIIIYDTDFNFIKDFSTGTHGTNFDYVNSNLFLYTNFFAEDCKHFYVIDKSTGTIKGKYKDFLRKQRGVGCSTSGFAKHRDSLYISFPYDYSIYKVTEDGCEKYLHVDFGEENIFENFMLDFSYDERKEYQKLHYSHICDTPVAEIDDLYLSDSLLFFTFIYHCFEYKVFWNRISQKYHAGYINISAEFPFANFHFLTIFNDQVIAYALPEDIHDFFGYSDESREKAVFPRNLLKQMEPTDNPVLCIYTLKNN